MPHLTTEHTPGHRANYARTYMGRRLCTTCGGLEPNKNAKPPPDLLRGARLTTVASKHWERRPHRTADQLYAELGDRYTLGVTLNTFIVKHASAARKLAKAGKRSGRTGV